MKRATRTILALCITAALAACNHDSGEAANNNDGSNPQNPGGNENPAGNSVVTGLVTETGTGKRLPGVAVSVQGKTTTTNTNGEFNLSNLAAGGATVTFALNNYVSSFTRVELGSDPAPVMVKLKKQTETQTYSPQSSKTFSHLTAEGPYALILSAGSVDSTDSSLEVAITPLDPFREGDALPAIFNNNFIPLRFANIAVLDDAGNPVDLKNGASATVEMPVPIELRDDSFYALGQSVSFYQFNEAGQWQQIAAGTVQKSSVDDATPVLRASVPQLTWVGAVQPAQLCHDVFGKVVNATTAAPIANVTVNAYPGSSATTDAQGLFSMRVPVADYTDIVATRTYVDVDGSVSGTQGTRVIEVGKMESLELKNLAAVSCDAASSKPGLTPRVLGEQSDPIVIKIAPLTNKRYYVEAELFGFSDEASGAQVWLYDQTNDDVTGTPVSGARITLDGPDNTVELGELEDGLYWIETAIQPGKRYTLNIDADNNGTIDGSGSIFSVGDIVWETPVDNVIVQSDDVQVQWSDSARNASNPDYNVVYLATVVNVDGNSNPNATADFGYYLGTDLQFVAQSALNPGENLVPGTYTGVVMAFSGPYVASYDQIEYDVVPNITGPQVNGDFNAFSMQNNFDVRFVVE